MELGFSWPRQEGNGSCIPAVGLRDPGSALPGDIVGTPQFPLTREATRVRSSAKYTEEECSDERTGPLVVVSSAPR